MGLGGAQCGGVSLPPWALPSGAALACAPPSVQDVFGNTPLINLAKKNDQVPRMTLMQRLEAAVYLIEKGAKINHVNREGLSAITTAVRDCESVAAGAPCTSPPPPRESFFHCHPPPPRHTPAPPRAAVGE